MAYIILEGAITFRNQGAEGDPRFVIFGLETCDQIMKKHKNCGLEAPKIHPKAIKMVPRSAPQGILGER